MVLKYPPSGVTYNLKSIANVYVVSVSVRSSMYRMWSIGVEGYNDPRVGVDVVGGAVASLGFVQVKVTRLP
jgi:hypothetical protein